MANLTPNQLRCQDCINLVEKNGKWTCDECFGQLVEEIDDCPEGFTLEEQEELIAKAKENKISHGAKNDSKPKATKPKTVKVSDEKTVLYNNIFTALYEIYGDNLTKEKENKLFSLKIGSKQFKIDIVEHRPPKKKP